MCEDMVFACLRHPCTLILAILTPKIEFGSDRYFYYPATSAAAPEDAKSSVICLVALACAQFILRLTENFLVYFCYGGQGTSETVKVVDLLDCVLDGVFLVQMTQSLYKMTMKIGHDGDVTYGFNHWLVWWKSRRLVFLWTLYTIFVAISTVLVLIGVSTFFRKSNFKNNHFVYTDQKAHDLLDLLLLTGSAIVLIPNPVDYNGRLENIDDEREMNYYLLRGGRHEDESDAPDGDNQEEGGEVIFEMTTTSLGTSNFSSTLRQEQNKLSSDDVHGRVEI